MNLNMRNGKACQTQKRFNFLFKRMKKAMSNSLTLLIRGACILFLFPALFGFPAGQAQKSQDQLKYKKIVVLAKVEQNEIERQFENAMVAALTDKGYVAIPSYKYFTPSDMAHTDRLLQKADSLQIDALLAFTLISVESTVSRSPQVNASIGVPVNLGFFSVYLGTSVPLGGGSREEKTAHVKAAFYHEKGSTDPSWQMSLSGNLDNGNDALIYDFTKKTLKAMFKQKVL